VRDVLGRYAVGRQHAHERVPQLPRAPLFPQPGFLADDPEVAAHVPRAAGSTDRAGEDQIVLLPPRPSSQPLGVLPGLVLAERVGNELGQCQGALAPLGLGVAVGTH
jgi:hypothetical protein